MSVFVMTLLLSQLPPPIQIVHEGKPYSVEERMQFHGVPGCSVVTLRDFKVHRVWTFGVTAKGQSNRVTRQTLFPAGQMSEPIAHVIALQLVDQKRLLLDEPVRTHLKRYSPPAAKVELTLRHLLTGRGGYTLAKYMGFDASRPYLGLPEELKLAQTEGEPGAMWHRSPVNVSVMQVLMEDVTGKTMNELLPSVYGRGKSRYLAFPPDQAYRQFAKGHAEDGTPESNGGRAYPELAATGLWTNGEEFGRFLGQLMANTQAKSKRPLRPESAKMLLAPIETIDQNGMISRNEAMTFGSDEFHGQKLYFRGGANCGYYCQAWFKPESGNAIIVFTNRQLAYLFANEVREALMPTLLKPSH